MRRLAALGLAVLLYALPVHAQEQSGTILGVVKDTSGAVLPGVTVEVRSAALVGVATAISDGGRQLSIPGAAARHV